MKFELDINPSYIEVKVVIQAPKMNTEVSSIIDKIESLNSVIISGKQETQIYVLDAMEIDCFYTLGRKVYASTSEQTFEVKQKLYELEEIVPKDRFIRISKSAIVNILKIHKINMSFNGSLVVQFKNKKEEIISRRYVNAVKKFINLGGEK
ncbi:MAG: LytTR family transcriptional regulator [Clostridia bacterium]|nr:LytTR family transcriptional regulator [Clostridia bacterium]